MEFVLTLKGVLTPLPEFKEVIDPSEEFKGHSWGNNECGSAQHSLYSKHIYIITVGKASQSGQLGQDSSYGKAARQALDSAAEQVDV